MLKAYTRKTPCRQWGSNLRSIDCESGLFTNWTILPRSVWENERKWAYFSHTFSRGSLQSLSLLTRDLERIPETWRESLRPGRNPWDVDRIREIWRESLRPGRNPWDLERIPETVRDSLRPGRNPCNLEGIPETWTESMRSGENPWEPEGIPETWRESFKRRTESTPFLGQHGLTQGKVVSQTLLKAKIEISWYARRIQMLAYK